MTDSRANILIVDDREENLVALEAILEPLDQTLIRAQSGEEALRHLLVHDVAVILLDVQMPDLDGFETAALIKQREKTRAIPIIFLTAISKEEIHVFRGYSAGAVDYLFKPFDPDILRSKVSVFIELYRKGELIKQQEAMLRERQLTELARTSEQRYRALADAMPQIVWTAGADGKATYYNRRWYEYTGLEPARPDGDEWIRVIHADDLAKTRRVREETLESGDVFEVQYRFRNAEGVYRWHLGRALPLRNDAGKIEFWVGTATDIDDQKRIEQAQNFLLRAGAELASTLDYRRALQSVAKLAVPEIADWCAVDLVNDDGTLEPLTISHVDPSKVTLARELRDRYGASGNGAAQRVVDTGESELVSHISDEMLAAAASDELHLDLLRDLSLRSYISAPITTRRGNVGALSLIASESGRRFEERDLRLVEELARRAGAAIENSRLYREVEARAQASRVLAAIGDGVALVDSKRVIRIWNTAAETITGIKRADVVGKTVSEALPDVEQLEERIPVTRSGRPAAAETLPVEIGGRELWLSISGVAFEDGVVFAFRDLTEERRLEQMRQDLVATVSHELRTPLAAIYGSAATLRRDDIEIEAVMQDKLLEVIFDEAARLADIVNDLLLASQLDSGRLDVNIESCDPVAIARAVVDAAKTHTPESVVVEVDAPAGPVSPVAADEGQLRQVVANVLDNAIKYSPDGGTVRIAFEPADSFVRFAISDTGLGVPSGERNRIFEKFYRLDPDMTRGIGGTGLGLYICRELVRRVNGRIWVDANNGQGSVFYIEIPVASAGVGGSRRDKAAASA